MKTLIAALVACAAMVALDGFAPVRAEDGIKQTFAQLDACVAKNDAACVGELMTDDATMLGPEGGVIIRGRSQIVKHLKGLMGTSPGAAGAKQTHVIERLRMIGDDHAVVDGSVSVASGKEEGTYHSVAVLVRKDGKWLFEDVRTYVVQTKKAGEASQPAAPAPTGAAPGAAPATPMPATSPGSPPSTPPAQG